MLKIIDGKMDLPLKAVFYGPEGIGKSTLASKAPNPLFIDTEGGTSRLNVRRIPKPDSWTGLLNVIAEVAKTPGICQTLVLDTADWAEMMCIEELCSKYKVSGLESFGYGKGYTYVAEEMSKLLAICDKVVDAGMNVIIIAHAKMRKQELPDEQGALTELLNEGLILMPDEDEETSQGEPAESKNEPKIEEPVETEQEAEEKAEPDALDLPGGFSFPLSEHTGLSLRNLVNLIYSRADLINKAVGSHFHVEKQLVEFLEDDICTYSVTNFRNTLEKYEAEHGTGLIGLELGEESVNFTGFDEDAPDEVRYRRMYADYLGSLQRKHRINL